MVSRLLNRKWQNDLGHRNHAQEGMIRLQQTEWLHHHYRNGHMRCCRVPCRISSLGHGKLLQNSWGYVCLKHNIFSAGKNKNKTGQLKLPLSMLSQTEVLHPIVQYSVAFGSPTKVIWTTSMQIINFLLVGNYQQVGKNKNDISLPDSGRRFSLG